MKPWRVVAGLSIVAGMFAVTSPVWVNMLRGCLGVGHGSQIGPMFDLYVSCSTAVSQVFSMLPIFIPGLGTGIWITIFALKDISFVTFKKEAKQAA